jgi:tRNA-2-methylthio-N6-dimethylallyladenosine synthase
MSHFHLPVQCGSDEVLKRMKRDYTVAQYLERLEKLRAARPGIAITTDIIVGFPGETDADFEATFNLAEQVRFDGQYAFVYSPRPKTVAGVKEETWGPVPHEVKVARLERLNQSQKRISVELMSAFVGKTVEVLVEGRSKTDPSRRFGRTPHNRVVNFDGDAPVGALVEIAVAHSSSSGLVGTQARVISLPVVEIPEIPQTPEVCVA